MGPPAALQEMPGSVPLAAACGPECPMWPRCRWRPGGAIEAVLWSWRLTMTRAQLGRIICQLRARQRAIVTLLPRGTSMTLWARAEAAESSLPFLGLDAAMMILPSFALALA
eukprot:3394901-Pyramimonas_sp.AAC.1